MTDSAIRTGFAGHISIAIKADRELKSNLSHLLGSSHHEPPTLTSQVTNGHYFL